jgi:xanthine dehydrogenase/oxidase
MAFGGMAPTTTMAQKTMDFLKGKLWSTETIDEACDKLLEDLPLPASVPGGMVRYRQSLAISFLFKAFLTVSKKSGISPVPEEFHSATEVMIN